MRNRDFGSLPFVRDNFTFVILAIVFISILPAVFEFLRERTRKSQSEAEPPSNL